MWGLTSDVSMDGSRYFATFKINIYWNALVYLLKQNVKSLSNLSCGIQRYRIKQEDNTSIYAPIMEYSTLIKILRDSMMYKVFKCISHFVRHYINSVW